MSSSSSSKPRKAGVATDSEFEAFMYTFGAENIVVVDARNPDFEQEPGDRKSDDVAPIAGTGTASYRPRTVNLVYDRANKTMPLEVLEKRLEEMAAPGKDTAIITHCGGGGRGQKAKDFLESAGYTNVINGGGPKVTELWEKYGNI